AEPEMGSAYDDRKPGNGLVNRQRRICAMEANRARRRVDQGRLYPRRLDEHYRDERAVKQVCAAIRPQDGVAIVKDATQVFGESPPPPYIRSSRFTNSSASRMTESHRVYRRAHSERGWSPCPDPASTPRSCVTAQSGWCSITPPSIPRNGRRFDRWPRRSAARSKPCAGGFVKPSATPGSVRA